MKICPTCQRTYPDDFSLCPRDGARLASQGTETEAQIAAGLARRYRIVRRLGQGGMGTVFLAQQMGVANRSVALKILNRKLLDDPEFLLRFQNEAGSMGLIRHANVVTIYESAQADDGTPYIAMEFLEGESLREALQQRGPLPVSEVVVILQQTARGLNAAHRLGIIHRDIKPDNIFLTHGDEGELIVKVVDFGIAKLRESVTHTMTGMVLGTPAYMSYEQASGMRSDELDARSDVYSLGVVVYEMLSGRVPFHSDTPLGYVRKHMMEAPPSFRAIAPALAIPSEVESAVMRALVKDRDQRYASALDFAREFGRAAPAPSQAEAERREKEKAAAELAAEKKAEQERLAREKAEAERREREKVAADQAVRQRAEQDRLARERAEAERRERERAEQERLVREKAEAARRERERVAAMRTATLPPPAEARAPQFQPAPQPSIKMKVAAITVVALIMMVAGVWYFWPSPSPPVGNPQTQTGAPPTGNVQQIPTVDTPMPAQQTPAVSDTDTANRVQQVKESKRRGDNFFENGQYDNAINIYQAGLDLDPSNGPLLKALRRAQTAKAAEEKFNRAGAGNRLQLAQVAKARGDSFFDNGQYDNAIRAYQEGLKLDPSNAQLLQALQRAQTAKAAEEKFNH